jgi:curved DNA-binding protein CbpA
LKRTFFFSSKLYSADKNFHPDSKVAFEAIQEAFETLSSPVKRDAYDTEQRKRTGRPSLKRTISRIKGECSNLKSRLMLFWVRVFVRGEGNVEFKELVGDNVSAMSLAVSRTLEHFALQPSALDRLRLVTEMTYDFRTNVFSSAPLAALLIG